MVIKGKITLHESVLLYVIFFSIFEFFDTFLLAFRLITNPNINDIVVIINLVILSPVMEEFIFRIFPLGIAPFFFIKYSKKRYNIAKYIIFVVLILFNAYNLTYYLYVLFFINYDPYGNYILYIFVIFIVLELIYCWVIFNFKKYFIYSVLIISAILFGLIHVPYWHFLRFFPTFCYGMVIGIFYYNRLNLEKWDLLPNKVKTKNIFFASFVVWSIHFLNNLVFTIPFSNNIILNSVFQDIIIICIFSLIIKLSINKNNEPVKN